MAEVHNVFISFRYKDGHTYKEELDDVFDRSVVIQNYSEDEDRSDKSDAEIQRFLYGKLRGTSVTVILLTQGALEYKRKYGIIDDWIYDEVRYSLEDREGNRPNGIIAVYVPEIEDQIFHVEKKWCSYCGEYHTIQMITARENLYFKNMFNHKEKVCSCDNIYDRDWDHYCSLVAWEDFIKHYRAYINCAFKKRERLDEYNLVKRLQ